MPNNVTNRVIITGDKKLISDFERKIFINNMVPGAVDFNSIIPMTDVDDKKGWYDWRISNWGTKWNAYGYTQAIYHNSECLEIGFLTAWTPPHPIVHALSCTYPDLVFAHRWADEDIGNNCGERLYGHGQLLCTYIPETRKESIEYAAEVMYSKPEDWGLTLNSDSTDYVYFDND